MDEIKDYISEHKWFLIMGIMVLMSVFANFGYRGQIAYYIAMLIGAFISSRGNEKFNPLYLLLPAWLFVTSYINNVVDLRLSALFVLLACAAPVFSSYKNFVFRGKLLYAICMLLPLTSVLNLYAYRAGINYILELNDFVADINFSGFTPHPMWLAAINGAANVVLTYLIMKLRSKESENNIMMGILVAFLVASLYLSVVAASRGALLASLVAMAVVVYCFMDSASTIIKTGIAISIVTAIALPILQGGSEQMMLKMENDENQGNSRSQIWSWRIEEFLSSPLIGIGFATGKGEVYDEDLDTVVVVKQTGSVESGSGWLAILSQSGLIGAFLVFLMMKGIYIPFSEIKENRGVLVLFVSVFIYLCVHSLFEGYIYTAGYCPCLFFWLLVGQFTEYNKFKYEYDDVLEEIEEMEFINDDEDDDEEADDEEEEKE